MLGGAGTRGESATCAGVRVVAPRDAAGNESNEGSCPRASASRQRCFIALSGTASMIWSTEETRGGESSATRVQASAAKASVAWIKPDRYMVRSPAL